MDEETAERIFDQSTLTGFYKTEIRPCKAMCKRTEQLCIRLHVAKRLTGFKLCATTQQPATTCNRVCKRTKNVTSNNVASVRRGFYKDEISTYSARKD